MACNRLNLALSCRTVSNKRKYSSSDKVMELMLIFFYKNTKSDR